MNREEVLKEEKVPGICVLVDTNNKRSSSRLALGNLSAFTSSNSFKVK